LKLQLVSKRRRLCRERPSIAEVDSDTNLELPAEASGIITLKAEEDAVAVGAVFV
jgi:hypothetical protein